MFSVDSCFIKGADHSVCQDYTTHGFIGGDPTKPYIILCDGCSSAKDSDFGARLLSRACVIAIEDLVMGMSVENINIADIESLIRSTLGSIIRSLAYDTQHVLATVMLAFVIDGVTFIYSRGDGTIHIKRMNYSSDDTHIFDETIHVSYSSSAPFYLAYDLIPSGRDQYLKQFDVPRTVTTHIDGVYCASIDESATSVFSTYMHGVESIILSSDGMDSFRKMKSVTGIDESMLDRMHVLSRVKSFKNSSPGFVQRRVNRMEQENQKFGIEHYDDFSVAAIVRIPNA